ncbi:hypothetical protein COI88_28735 [Bacillus cereus]|nr:hypothetical protein COI88_28735 [Bacillus cereus]
MVIKWNLKSSLLKFALADTGDNTFRNFCKPLIIKHLNVPDGSRLLEQILKDYQGASGPLSLGRHLLTYISINALGINRNEEYDDMAYKQMEFKPVIDSLKKEFPTEYQEALDELRCIVKETQKMIRNSGKKQVTLYRRLCVKEGGVVSGQLGNNKILIDTNILTSYTTSNKIKGYTGEHWSDVGIVRNIPIDQVIIHPSYIQIVEFEFAEMEAIIYNPNQRVVLQHPDKAFKV